MDNLIKLLLIPTIFGLSSGLVVTQNEGLNTNIRSSLRSIYEYRDQTLSDNPSIKSLVEEENEEITPTPVVSASPTPSPIAIVNPTAIPEPTTSDWGVAEKVGDHTYTIKVGNDEQMASPREVMDALNAYRSTNGISTLSWSDTLASYAQTRADHFKNIGTVDGHEGFNNYLENESGFDKLGFRKLGENSYFGGPLTGTHLIEWVFSQSPGHNANQLDSGWSHVGVGVTDTSVNLIFGGDKM